METSSVIGGVSPAAVLSTAAVASASGCADPLAAVLIGTPEITAVLQRSTALIDEVPALAAAHHVLADYQAARSRRFDAFLADAVRAGVRQCVILAAGLDTRAFRLRWPAETTIFEVEWPKVLEFKTAVLDAHGAQRPEGWYPVAVAADGRWPRELWNAGFNHNEPTAWLAEALLPLPDDAQDVLLSEIDGLSAAGSVLAYDDALGRCSGRSDAADWLTSRGWWTDVVDARDLPELAAHRAEMSEHAVLGTAQKIA
ncbi:MULTISPECIES: SAM-dependent methyltransferase [Mycobacteriaceae]|uniref:SAM-dependent methyltransferase n=1 Tax=Mycobacteriaceae TaxID=1762 RepID=UPI000800C405|nr:MULTISPECIES: SAM-dependent methyltransferase [Mycobacteriaceae]MCK0177040.1 SAM-dependent methyltransferase [Mycolicibacterium sp. F2034L]OBB57671.1 SAM-dependent methyltransferase [Mycobacterium sp. 852013-51886_SCH5428379]